MFPQNVARMVDLLFVGDIHLGRTPSRIDSLSNHGLRPADLSPARAWALVVDHAIETRVDAVVLAGDVVESVEDRFEAFGHLEAGVRRLAQAGIPTYGVAGNHDVRALPRLASEIEHFHLLGADGRWQRVAIEGRDGEIVDLVGWSFPRAQVPESPLSTFDATALVRQGVVTLGVVHGDLDQPRSVYAPLARAELEATGLAAWFLGHIHRPDDLAVERPIGYLGSLAGLDPGPGERGRHGPWHVRVEHGRITSVEQLPLAPLRYERLEVTLEGTGVEDEQTAADELERRVREAIERRHDAIRSELGWLRAVVVRVRVTGTAPRPRFVAEAREGGLLDRVYRLDDNVLWVVEKLVDESVPALDLERLACSDDPPGLLARRLIALQAGSAEGLDLAARFDDELRRAWRAAQLEGEPGPPEDLRPLLIQAGWEALRTLLAQRSPEGKQP